MKVNAADYHTSTQAILRVLEKVEVDAGAERFNAPNLSASPSQLNRSYEVSSEPPLTVLKFTNPETKEIEYQIPNEVSVRMYREIQNYLKRQEEELRRV